jgi:glycoside/pentoside/hexuronide:cation symporter, GPH family
MSSPSAPRAPARAAEIPADERIPLKEKIAYGAGGLGGGIASNVDNYLLSPVFVLLMGISPGIMGLCNILYRLWDAVTDLWMGWLSDRTRSRWGRRKPYILIGAILAGTWMPVLYFFDRAWEKPVVIAWMIAAQLVLTLFTTVWNIPYQCQLFESTPNSTERTNMSAWRGYVGHLAGLGMSWVWYLTQLPIFHNELGQPDVLNGARWVIGAIAVLTIVLGLLPLLVKERTHVNSQASGNTLSLRENLRLTFTSKAFLVLIFFTLLFSIGTNLKSGLQFYTTVTYVCGGDQKLASLLGGLSGGLGTAFGLLGIPVFQWIARRYGKIHALKCIMYVSGCASLSTFFLYTPAFPYLSLLPGILLSPCGTGIWVIIPSMLGDVVDDDTVRHRERREASFAASFSWTLKLSLSAAAGLAGLLVVLAGFNADLKVNQPPDVIFNMRVLLCLMPALFVAAALFLLRRYPLTNERLDEIRTTLLARRENPTA